MKLFNDYILHMIGDMKGGKEEKEQRGDKRDIVPSMIKKEDFDLRFSYLANQKKFHIHLNPITERLFFNPRGKPGALSLHQLLGFKDQIVKEAGLSHFTSSLNLEHSLMFVYCNLVDYTSIGSQEVNILRFFNISDILRATIKSSDTNVGKHSKGKKFLDQLEFIKPKLKLNYVTLLVFNLNLKTLFQGLVSLYSSKEKEYHFYK